MQTKDAWGLLNSGRVRVETSEKLGTFDVSTASDASLGMTPAQRGWADCFSNRFDGRRFHTHPEMQAAMQEAVEYCVRKHNTGGN